MWVFDYFCKIIMDDQLHLLTKHLIIHNYNDKIYICDNYIDTKNFGHYKIRK